MNNDIKAILIEAIEKLNHIRPMHVSNKPWTELTMEEKAARRIESECKAAIKTLSDLI